MPKSIFRVSISIYLSMHTIRSPIVEFQPPNSTWEVRISDFTRFHSDNGVSSLIFLTVWEWELISRNCLYVAISEYIVRLFLFVTAYYYYYANLKDTIAYCQPMNANCRRRTGHGKTKAHSHTHMG